MADATIITASLDSTELQNSVTNLVKSVNEGLSTIKKNFDQTIGDIQNGFKNIGGASSSGGSTQRTQKLKEEQNAADKTRASYDQLVNAMRQAAIQADKRYSVNDEMINLRTSLHDVEFQLKKFGETDTLRAKYDEIQQKIREIANGYIEAEQKAKTLVSEEQRYAEEVRKTAAAIRESRSWKEQGFSVLNGNVYYDTEKINASAQTKREIGTLEEQIARSLRSQTTEIENQASGESKVVAEAKQLEITTKQIADHTRAFLESSGRSDMFFGKFYDAANGSQLTPKYLYAENDERARGLTIEQQILNIRREHEEVEQRITQQKKEQANAKTNKAEEQKTFTTYEDLRQAIAHVLSVRKEAINMAETETASYQNLTASLKQLNTAYQKLTASERSSDNGKALLATIHELEQAIAKINSQKARPLNLQEIMGIKPQTIEEMTSKLQMLQSYKRGLNITDPKQASEIKQVDNEINRLNKDLNKYMSTTKQAMGANNALARSWNYMKNRLAFYFTVGASTQFIKNLIDVRSQYEMNERALGILVDSAERGTQIFNELSQMALVSPYTLIELSAAAKQLTAYDIAANDVVDTTRRLADMASAVGVPIERLTYALGQIKAYGYLNSRDARMFANAGIPLVKELSNYYTELEGKMVSVGDIYDRIKKKSIGFEEVIAVINKMTDEGGKFFDFQAKMADTLKVRLANLTLAWNNMLNDIGASNQGVLTLFIGGLRTLFSHWKDFNKLIYDMANAFIVLKSTQILWYRYHGKVSMALATQHAMGKKLTNVFAGLGATLKKLALNPWTWIFVGIAAITSFISHAVEANKRIAELNNTISKHGVEGVENINKFMRSMKETYESLYKWDTKDGNPIVVGTKDIDRNEAVKAWAAIREQIELSSSNANYFIRQLETINDVNKRVRAGFDYLNMIADAKAILSEIGDQDIQIKITQDSWMWGIFGEGATSDLRDYSKALKEIIADYGDLGNAIKENSVKYDEYRDKEIEFEKELKPTIESLKEIFDTNLFDFSGKFNEEDFTNSVLKAREIFEQVVKEIAENEKMTAQETSAFRIKLEQEVAEEYKLQFMKVSGDTGRAMEDLWAKNWGMGQASTTEFLDWLQRTHSHVVDDMYRNMTQKQIESIDISDERWAKWIDEMLNGFKETHYLAYNDLTQYVDMANLLRVVIPVHFSLMNAPSDLMTDILNKIPDLDLKIEGDDLTEVLDKADKKVTDLTKSIKDLKNAGAEKETSPLHKTLVAEQKELEENQKLLNAYSRQSSVDAKASKAAAAAARKNAKARAAAQREAESELQKAFKDELQLIDKVRSQYKKLTDSGVSGTTAMTMVTNQFKNSINQINKVLGKNGIPLFDIKAFAGTDNPHQLLKLLNAQLQAGKSAKNVKPVEIKDLEIKVGEITVDAKVYNTKKIADGLNNELGRLKEDYELAVVLDSDPELGGLFADAWGINIDNLPTTAEEYAEQYTKVLNKYLKGVGSNLQIPNLLNLTKDDMEAFESMVANEKFNKEWYERILTGYKDVRDKRQKEVQDSINDWNKLLEEYAEYETRRKEIVEKTEKDIKTATERGASKLILDAIRTRGKQKLAGLNFEEFQKSPYWITATGSLTSLTTSALQMLIDKLEQYKKSARNLDPKQIDKINKALRNLRKEIRKDNPWSAMAITIDEAIANGDNFRVAMDEVAEKIEELNKLHSEQGYLSPEDQSKLKKYILLWEKLEKAEEEASKVSFAEINNALGQYVSKAKNIADSLTKIAESIGNEDFKKAAELTSDIVGNFQAAEEGAEAWGGWWGAIIGGLTDLIPKIIKWADKDYEIVEQIQQQEKSVKALERAYNELQFAIEESLGADEIYARRQVLINKQQQLAEKERQLALEKSRKQKHQDENAISQLEDDILNLQHEIKELSYDVANMLLGSDIKSAAEGFVSTWVSAWRQGGDTIDELNQKFDGMIDNMIMKALASRVVARRLKPIFDIIETISGNESEEEMQAKLKEIKDFIGNGNFSKDIDEFLTNLYGYLGIGQGTNGEKSLSALQQGIQGITEDTAGALEAYMNGVSQQVYLHSDLLTQIRDAVVSFNIDVQTASMGQILLQLQASYQSQQAIQSILEGVLTPSGRAFSVELN